MKLQKDVSAHWFKQKYMQTLVLKVLNAPIILSYHSFKSTTYMHARDYWQGSFTEDFYFAN